MTHGEIRDRTNAEASENGELLALLSTEAFAIQLTNFQRGREAGGQTSKPADPARPKEGDGVKQPTEKSASVQKPEHGARKLVSGQPFTKADGSTVTRNEQGLPTLIHYPTGESRQVEYFQDGKSIKALWLSGYTDWRKSPDTNEWYRAHGDKVDGPQKRSFFFGKDDQLITEDLENKHHYKTVSYTAGGYTRSIDGKREIHFDTAHRPAEIIDGNQTWKRTDITKNEWKSKTGQVEHIAVEDGEYSYRDSQQFIHRFPLTGQQRLIKASDLSKILTTGKISRQFEDTVTNSVGSIPQHLIDRLALHGYKINANRRTTETFPHLKGTHPRGWPSTFTWDRVNGLLSPTIKTIGIAETVTNGNRFVTTENTAGVARHETGHAVDKVIGHSGLEFSSTPEFVAAYNQDVARMSARDKSVSAYTLQSGEPGREECFAEVFGTIYGGPCNLRDRERIERAYPAVRAAVVKRIDDVEKMSRAQHAQSAQKR